MRVLVTGGRGALGRLLVPRLIAAGHDVLVTSRRADASAPAGTTLRQLDLRAEQIAPAVFDGVDVVVHAATDPARPQAVDVRGTERMLHAAASSGVGHVVYLSIVGVDDHPFPYYRAKVAAEQVVEAGGVPVTILRATQFHEFLDRIFSTGPVVLAFKGVEFQVVDGAVVAQRLAELVSAGPQGRADDLGGPTAESMQRMADSWKAATGTRRPRATIPAFGSIGRAFLAKQHHTPNCADGTVSWDEWLADRYARGAATPEG